MKDKLKQLEKKFNSEIWQRGKEYYRKKLIGNIVKDSNVIKAESYGNSTYFLKINLKTNEMDCTCPYDFECKHLAALIIWLKNNKITDLSEQLKLLKSKNKEELIEIITKMLKNRPELSKLIEHLDEEAIIKLIKELDLPRYGYDTYFFNKIDSIKDFVKKENFILKLAFLMRLLDIFDKDPDSFELEDYINEYVSEILEDKKLTKTQEKTVKKLVEKYPFEY